jgi:hypothetical protein
VRQNIVHEQEREQHREKMFITKDEIKKEAQVSHLGFTTSSSLLSIFSRL